LMTDHEDGIGARSERLLTFSFLALLVGQIVSIMGDRLNNMAMIDLITLETGRFRQTGSVFELSKLALAMTLPSLILGPFVGAFVDRAHRKRVLVTSDVIRGFAVLAIPFLRPALPMWTVYGAVAGLYIANLFFLPARCAIVSELVARPNLLRANSLLSMGATAATVAGFGLGGLVVASLGWRTVLFVDAATYFFSAGALACLAPKADLAIPPQGKQPPYPRVIKEAITEIRKSSAAMAGVFVPAIVTAAGTVVYILGVALIEAASRRGTELVGLIAGVAGAGMALGCYLTAKVLRGVSRDRIALGAALACVVALAATGLARSLPVMGLAVAAAGLAAGPVLVASETAIQEEAKRHRQATVFALRDALMKLGSAAAALAAPAMALKIGARPGLVLIVGLLIPLLAVAAWRKTSAAAS
jgi:MFS transporter, DHA3 family, macrolide efflux protein